MLKLLRNLALLAVCAAPAYGLMAPNQLMAARRQRRCPCRSQPPTRSWKNRPRRSRRLRCSQFPLEWGPQCRAVMDPVLVARVAVVRAAVARLAVSRRVDSFFAHAVAGANRDRARVAATLAVADAFARSSISSWAMIAAILDLVALADAKALPVLAAASGRHVGVKARLVVAVECKSKRSPQPFVQRRAEDVTRIFTLDSLSQATRGRFCGASAGAARSRWGPRFSAAREPLVISLDVRGEKPYRSTLTHRSPRQPIATYTMRRSTPQARRPETPWTLPPRMPTPLPRLHRRVCR